MEQRTGIRVLRRAYEHVLVMAVLEGGAPRAARLLRGLRGCTADPGRQSGVDCTATLDGGCGMSDERTCDELSPSEFLISKMEGMDDVTQVLIVTRTGDGENQL